MDWQTLEYLCELTDHIVAHGMTPELEHLVDACKCREITFAELVVTIRHEQGPSAPVWIM